MADIVSGVTLGNKTDSLTCVEVPYLRVANVQDGYLDLSDVKTIKVTPTQCEKLLLQKGDVLMNEGGDFDKLGRGTVWRGEINRCIHQNHVFRVRPNTKKLRSNYLAFWSQFEFGKSYFILSSKQSTNLASVNSTQLHVFHIMLPDIDEQDRIENRVEAINDRLDQLNAESSKYSLVKFGLMHDLLTGRVRVKVTESNKHEAAT